MSLDKTTLKINKGETSEALKATITPSGATGDKTITWKSDNTAIVTIDLTGKVTAVGPGTTQVEAKTANGKVALCTVTVFVPPTGIKINSENFSIDKGASKTLTATLEPTDCTDASVKWVTDNSDIASVDKDGKVTGIAPGKATITVSTLDGKYSASCKVTVVISISSLTLDQASLTLFKDSQTTLTATIVPPDTTEDKTVTWSSTNPAVATVDSNGLITAVEGGTTTITAQAGSHIAECKVTVIVPVTGIEMTEHSVTMAKGTDKTLSVKITPDDATDKLVTWASSDEKVATVDSSGKVTAVNVGSAVITATTHDGGYSVQCNLSVVIPVTGITLDKQSLTINRGSTSRLTASTTPADATDQAVLWQTTNPSVASVDQTGNITAAGAGNAVITVTTHDGGFIAQCNVTVIVPINTITLNQTSAVLLVQNNLNLAVSIDPPDTTEDKTVTWSSSDSSIATVDSAGKVTGIKAGNAVITAKVGTHAASCSITVKLPPVTWTITPDCSSDNVLLSGYNNDDMDTMSTVITTTEFNNPISMNSISVSSSYSVYYGSGSYYYGSYDCPIGGYVAYTDGTKLNMNSLYNPVITLDKTKKVQSIYLTVSYSGIHYHYQASYSAVVTVDSDDYGNFKLGSKKSQEHV